MEIDTFVPYPLLEHPVRTTSTDVAAVAEASAALSFLSNASDHLNSLAGILLRTEAIASSRVEGLFLSTRRVFEAQHAPDSVDDTTACDVVANIKFVNRP